MSERRALNLDFWKFLAGQTVSNFGTSITTFALPLLVFKLTGSALNLGLAAAATFLPYLFFGLVIGAWTDRADRKRLMIACDIARAVVIGSIPVAFLLGWLSVWWIYGAAFLESTLSIAFTSGQFAAVPSLVESDDLVTANGRLNAAFEAAGITGPFLAGILLLLVPIATLFTVDAASFLVSALSLALVRRSFNGPQSEVSQHLFRDVIDGLRYVLSHPVLRMISAMMALFNLFNSTTYTQVVLFAKQRLAATDTQVGWLYAAASVATILFSLNAGRLRRRFSFSQVILGVLAIDGLLLMVFSQVRLYWVGLLLWALWAGVGSIFDINTMSLRQAIVPNAMLGRVMTIAGVLAWSAIPVGTVTGGLAIQWTGHVEWIYLGIGVVTLAIPLAFALTPLGRADQYVPDAARRTASGAEETQPAAPR